MNFYKCILIFTILREVATDRNPELLFSGDLETPDPLSIGYIIFLVQINNTSDENDFDVEVTPDQCCLVRDEDIDCDYLNILGGCTDFVPKGKTKTLKVVAPLLDVYDRKGQCIVYVDSKSQDGRNNRDTLKINFDTAIENYPNVPNSFKHCTEIDEDPLNECKPVNCDTYYNGKKSYFNRKTKRCAEVPPCVSDSDYSSVLYNPKANQCFHDSVTMDDLNYIRNIKIHDNRRKSKDIYIIEKFDPNATEYNTLELDDVTTKRVFTKQKVAKPNKVQPHKDSFKCILKRYFINNKWTLVVLSIVITVQCFLICTMMYCLSRTCDCLKDKKVVRKFFNYRQDVSVTTPLIPTSNIDTETDYLYISESNVDQKIKCYKACQKENVQMSLSDDILSKCLNRRDWKKFPSEAINESNDVNDKFLEDITKIREEKVKLNESKVAYEDETKTNEKHESKIVKRETPVAKADDKDVEANGSSEKEIKCHSYNCFNAVSGFTQNVPRGCFKAETTKHIKSISTEKGAQAYFSNDSIDDFLSERGAIYLTGENVSKYTFSNDSNDIKQSTVTSKTSKNFIKSVLSLLHKKSKPGPSSDPGQNKEVELIHMSKASIYSSSNDSNCIRTLKRNDSRTSF